MARRLGRRKKSNPTQEALDLLKDIQDLILLKEKVYGCTWYQYATEGNMSHLAEKCLRFMNMKRRHVNYNYFEDTLQDLIVWAAFTLVCIHNRPEPKPIKVLSRKQLYGSMRSLDPSDMFVLSSKFYNSLYIQYTKRVPFSIEMIEDLINSLQRMKEGIDGRNK